MRHFELTPVFVEHIPPSLDEGKLYICCQYLAVMHLCACGCGVEVNTPLHPTGWKLTFDGKSVSLYPSVGNWSEDCQSHYVIRNNRVIWGYRFSRDRINQIRRKRRDDIALHYERKEDAVDEERDPPVDSSGIWAPIRRLFRID